MNVNYATAIDILFLAGITDVSRSMFEYAVTHILSSQIR